MQRNVTIMTCLGQLEKILFSKFRRNTLLEFASQPFSVCRQATPLPTNGFSVAVFREKRCVTKKKNCCEADR